MPTENFLSAPTRRELLAGLGVAATAAAFGGAAVFGSSGAFAAAPSSTDFLRLSEFLTGGKPLPAALATRFQSALARRDPSFNSAVATLQAFIADAKAPTFDDLLARPDMNDPLRKTASQIVSAWYLGIVGDADAELISYAEALMYRPTNDVLVIPTYGGGPDSWGEKPTEAAGTETVPDGGQRRDAVRSTEVAR